MRPALLAACLLFSVALSAGQLLLKAAAEDVKLRLATSWLSACLSPWLAAALALYAATTLLWLWVLAALPLSKAYPFALLGAALVPAGAALFAHETITPAYVLGMAMVIAGIAVIHLT